MSDRFYDYSSFTKKKFEGILKGWNGLGGYHGLMIKLIVSRISLDSTVLDIGCGLCHLWEGLQERIFSHLGSAIPYYVGIDIDPRAVKMAKERYPFLTIEKGTVYDLSKYGMFDVVVACGLYSGEPEKPDGVLEMLRHTKKKLILTYFHKEKGTYPPFFGKKINEIEHDIDERLTIVEIYK